MMSAGYHSWGWQSWLVVVAARADALAAARASERVAEGAAGRDTEARRGAIWETARVDARHWRGQIAVALGTP
jgi:hypothetical protein